MTTPFDHRPEKARKTFGFEIEYEGDNAHLVAIAMGNALTQALVLVAQQMEDQARQVEFQAQQIEERLLAQLTGQVPGALPYQQVPQHVPNNGRVRHGSS